VERVAEEMDETVVSDGGVIRMGEGDAGQEESADRDRKFELGPVHLVSL
jgi:hypothetical protein